MRIAIAADHNGSTSRRDSSSWLTEQGHERGRPRRASATDVVDYPPLCEDVCRPVVEGRADRGIVVGGSGAGRGRRLQQDPRHARRAVPATCSAPRSRRAHNDSNVLVVPAQDRRPRPGRGDPRHSGSTPPFKGGRHQSRIDQIAALERGEMLDRG